MGEQQGGRQQVCFQCAFDMQAGQRGDEIWCRTHRQQICGCGPVRRRREGRASEKKENRAKRSADTSPSSHPDVKPSPKMNGKLTSVVPVLEQSPIVIGVKVGVHL